MWNPSSFRFCTARNSNIGESNRPFLARLSPPPGRSRHLALAGSAGLGTAVPGDPPGWPTRCRPGWSCFHRKQGTPYCAWTKSCDTLKQWERLIVGIYRGIIIPGFLGIAGFRNRMCPFLGIGPPNMLSVFLLAPHQHHNHKGTLKKKYAPMGEYCRRK